VLGVAGLVLQVQVSVRELARVPEPGRVVRALWVPLQVVSPFLFLPTLQYCAQARLRDLPDLLPDAHWQFSLLRCLTSWS
jgi:hypothetical protein